MVTDPATCPPHWWLIPAAAGSHSQGVCRLCGAERLFANFIESSSYGKQGFTVGHRKKEPE